MAIVASQTSGYRSETALPAKVLSLTLICPATEDNPQDCPLHQLRKLTPRNRALWVFSLSEADLAYLAQYHDICQAIKLERQPVKPTAPAKPHKRLSIRKPLVSNSH